MATAGAFARDPNGYDPGSSWVKALDELSRDEALKLSARLNADYTIDKTRRYEMAELIAGLDFEIVSATGPSAQRVAATYERWGRGNHPASLNFGDCFVYGLASELGLPIVCLGNDFPQTDLETISPN